MKPKRARPLLALSLLLSPGSAFASPAATPETYARAAIAACNAGDAAKLQSLMESAYGPKATAAAAPAVRAPSRVRMCNTIGGWDLVSVDANTPTLYEATYAAHNLPVLRSQQHIEFDASGKIVADYNKGSAGFKHVPVLSDKALAQNFERWFGDAAKHDEYSGVVYVEHNGNPVLNKAYASSKYPGVVPAGVQTRFPIASMAKMFTAVSVAQLVERGKLRYDETLAQALPSYRGAGADRIKISQLLSHTSGVDDFFGDSFDAFKGDLPDNDSHLRFIEPKPLVFAPGTSWRYSNGGFVLLAAIVERASGQRFYDYVAQHIFKPAGMTHTSYDALGKAAPGVAWLYGGTGPDDYDFKPYTETRTIRGTGAGNAVSTVGDMAKFVHALLAGKLVGKHTVDLLFTPHGESPDIAPDAYGYGFELARRNGKIIPGHNGGMPFFAGGLRIMDGGKWIVVAFNGIGPQVTALVFPVEYLQTMVTQTPAE